MIRITDYELAVYMLQNLVKDNKGTKEDLIAIKDCLASLTATAVKDIQQVNMRLKVIGKKVV